MCDTDIDSLDYKSILAGDSGAFERLFRRYYEPLCRYCQCMVAEHEVSEDIVQDVFVYLWNNRDKLQVKISVKGYLYTSVRHGALRQLKRQVMELRHSSALTEFLEYLQTSEYSEEEMEKTEQVKKILEMLPMQCRTVFLMSRIEEKSYQEIADELNISINTVKTHVQKAYRVLRANCKSISSLLLIFLPAEK